MNQFAVQHGVFGYRDATNFAKPLEKDPQWHENAYPVNPTRVYSVLTILNALVKKVAPQSGWKGRLFALLADFPDIHRLSMAIPSGFEKSALWN